MKSSFRDGQRSVVIQVFILAQGLAGLNITRFLLTFYLRSADTPHTHLPLPPQIHVLKSANEHDESATLFPVCTNVMLQKTVRAKSNMDEQKIRTSQS